MSTTVRDTGDEEEKYFPLKIGKSLDSRHCQTWMTFKIAIWPSTAEFVADHHPPWVQFQVEFVEKTDPSYSTSSTFVRSFVQTHTEKEAKSVGKLALFSNPTNFMVVKMCSIIAVQECKVFVLVMSAKSATSHSKSKFLSNLSTQLDTSL